jgi:hypothetical protein
MEGGGVANQLRGLSCMAPGPSGPYRQGVLAASTQITTGSQASVGNYNA